MCADATGTDALRMVQCRLITGSVIIAPWTAANEVTRLITAQVPPVHPTMEITSLLLQRMCTPHVVYLRALAEAIRSGHHRAVVAEAKRAVETTGVMASPTGGHRLYLLHPTDLEGRHRPHWIRTNYFLLTSQPTNPLFCFFFSS